MNAIIKDGSVSVVLSKDQDERMIQLAAIAYAQAKAEQEALSKVYKVDGELVNRLQMCKDSIWDAINEGRIRTVASGTKKGYRITEAACREFLGDNNQRFSTIQI